MLRAVVGQSAGWSELGVTPQGFPGVEECGVRRRSRLGVGGITVGTLTLCIGGIVVVGEAAGVIEQGGVWQE